MRKRTVVAAKGHLIQEAIYPDTRRGSSQRVRDARKKMSSEAQKRMNAIYSWQKLKLMLASNFIRGDIVGCLTFDDQHLPDTRQQVKRTVNYFVSKLKAEREKHKQELVMFWAIEHKHGDGRWHIHFVCNSTGNDYQTINSLWNRGEIEMDELRVDNEKNYETLARYMAKEEREKVGLRNWSYTRNAKHPEVDVVDVPDDTQLKVPKDAILFADNRQRNEFGHWQFVEYIYKDALANHRAVKRRRKRK